MFEFFMINVIFHYILLYRIVLKIHAALLGLAKRLRWTNTWISEHLTGSREEKDIFRFWPRFRFWIFL